MLKLRADGGRGGSGVADRRGGRRAASRLGRRDDGRAGRGRRRRRRQHRRPRPGLGSGGFDIVHVNLTRGLAGGETPSGVHVMKMNSAPCSTPSTLWSSRPIRASRPGRMLPVLVLPLHGHLAPAAWSAAEAAGGRLRIGFVQASGGGLPGSLSNDLGCCASASSSRARLPRRHRSAASARRWPHRGHACGGGGRGMGCRHRRSGSGNPRFLHPLRDGGWRPSRARTQRSRSACRRSSRRGCRPRSAAPASRPQPSHHLRPRSVARRRRGPGAERARRALAAPRPRARRRPPGGVWGPAPPARGAVDLPGYAESGLPQRTMGRTLDGDLFFAAALAAGPALGEAAGS